MSSVCCRLLSQTNTCPTNTPRRYTEPNGTTAVTSRRLVGESALADLLLNHTGAGEAPPLSVITALPRRLPLAGELWAESSGALVC